MAKKRHKTSQQLAEGIAKFLKGKKKNKNNGELFEKAIEKAAKHDLK